MVLKSCRIALEWIVGLIAGLALLAALGLFWLSREPLPLDIAEPYLEAALSREDGISVEVGGTQLVWAGWGSRIQVAAQDWKVYNADGQRLITIPRAAIELSLSALVEGQIAPTEITLSDLRISLMRRADGRFAVNRARGEPPEEGPEDSGREGAPSEAPGDGDGGTAGDGGDDEAMTQASLLDVLFSPLADKPDPDNPFAQLSDVTVVDASAVFEDQRLRLVWDAPSVSLKIQRDTQGVTATGSATVALGPKQTQIGLTMTRSGGTAGLQSVITFEELEPSALAAVFPEAELLRGVGGSVDGRIGLTVAEDGSPSDATLELSSGELVVDLPERLAEPLAIRELELAASNDGPESPVKLERLSGRLAPAAGGGGPAFSVGAVAAAAGEQLEVELMAEVSGLPAEDLGLYWPQGVGGNGRAWVVENITAGVAESATLSARLRLDRDSLAVERIEEFGGRFRYRDLEVHYLRPMPPITGTTGSAAYDLAGLDFTVEQARRDEIEIGNGAISIFGLDGEDHRIAIAFDAGGPLQQALALLNHERLGLLENLGIAPEAAGGRFDVTASFAFPLIDELGFEQVQVAVEGRTRDTLLRGGVAGYDLEDGRFALEIDAEGLRADGEARVAGIPLQATWRESFQAVKFPTRVEAEIPSMAVAELARFGVDPEGLAEGELSLHLDLEANHRGDSRIAVDADLEQVSSRFAMLGWEKPAGKPGALEARLTIEDDSLVSIGDLAVTSGSDVARGELAFGPEGGLERAAFEELALGRNQVTGLVLAPLPEGGYDIAVRTGVLDLEPLLDEEAAPAAEATEPADAAPETSGPPYTPLHLEASSLARVRLGEGRALENVTLELTRDRRGWQLIEASAQIPRSLWRHRNRPVPEDAEVAAKSMSVHYGPEPDGSYRFELFADDIGAALRALDWVGSIEGGRGEIVGTLPGPLPDAPLEGRLETKGFRLVEAPAMAKLLTVASLTGIGNILSGEGIQFDRAVGRFTLQDDILRTPLFRAYGSSLGITAKGQIDLEGAGTDLAGTLVPAYSVNQVLGQIPILGSLLTGGEGEGILGVTYRVSGRIGDPEVSVNPLSILAPGFLRGLFSVPSGDSEEPEELTDVFPSGEVGR